MPALSANIGRRAVAVTRGEGEAEHFVAEGQADQIDYREVLAPAFHPVITLKRRSDIRGELSAVPDRGQ